MKLPVKDLDIFDFLSSEQLNLINNKEPMELKETSQAEHLENVKGIMEDSDIHELKVIAARLSEKALREAYDIINDECAHRGIRMSY